MDYGNNIHLFLFTGRVCEHHSINTSAYFLNMLSICSNIIMRRLLQRPSVNMHSDRTKTMFSSSVLPELRWKDHPWRSQSWEQESPIIQRQVLRLMASKYSLGCFLNSKLFLFTASFYHIINICLHVFIRYKYS